MKVVCTKSDPSLPIKGHDQTHFLLQRNFMVNRKYGPIETHKCTIFISFISIQNHLTVNLKPLADTQAMPQEHVSEGHLSALTVKT